jgi:thioesterase domain-containing protein
MVGAFEGAGRRRKGVISAPEVGDGNSVATTGCFRGGRAVSASEMTAGPGADWAAHKERMKRVRLDLLKQLLKRSVKNSVETIIDGTEKGPTICFIHSLLGAGSEVMDIADELGPARRLVSVRPCSADRNAVFANSIEKMAQKYVDELVLAEPEASFVLVGRSAGVVIALETARLLLARGRKIDLFVSLDFAPYNTGADIDRKNPRLAYQILRNWAVQLSAEFRKSPSLGVFFARLAGEARQRFMPPPLLSDAQRAAFNSDEQAFVEACDAAMKQYVYQPPADHFPVLTFLSTKQPDATEYNVRKKWRKILPSRLLEFVVMPGTTHRAVAEKPHVAKVARILLDRIDRLA